jgi:hypothetical protein
MLRKPPDFGRALGRDVQKYPTDQLRIEFFVSRAEDCFRCCEGQTHEEPKNLCGWPEEGRWKGLYEMSLVAKPGMLWRRGIDREELC